MGSAAAMKSNEQREQQAPSTATNRPAGGPRDAQGGDPGATHNETYGKRAIVPPPIPDEEAAMENEGQRGIEGSKQPPEAEAGKR
jgi:hypothetical protein